MVTKAQVEKASKLLNDEGLTKIKLIAVKESDLKKAFMDAVDKLIDAGKKDDIPMLAKQVYNLLIDEEEDGTEGLPEPSETPESEKPKKVGKGKKTDPAKTEVVDSDTPDVSPKNGSAPVPATTTDMTIENCPHDYDILKSQVKVLALSSANSFLLLGQRLTIIRDMELYKQDGYKNFKSFIDNELNIGKSQVYNAIDLVTYFGVQSIGNQPINPSVLIPALPLLKADEEKLTKADKKEVKTAILKEAKTKSEREMKEVVRGLKEKYGLIEEKVEKNKMDAAFDKLWAAIPDELTASDVKRVQKFIKKLEEILSE